MDGLTSRKEQVLRAVIIEYVAAAEPVPSDSIVQKYDLGVKSATVRNELAEITDLGFLEQPHTSAGRVPSDRGYRYFVDRLVVERAPGPREKEKVKTATEEEDTLHEILHETTKALSRLTHLLSAATVLRDTQVRVRSAVVTAVGQGKALLILVLQNGHIENRFIESPASLTLKQLGDANKIVASSTEGKTVGELSKMKAPTVADPVTAQLVKQVTAAVRAACKTVTQGRLITEGEEYVLAQPEFHRNAEEALALLNSIEDDETLRTAIHGHGVTIGNENPAPALHGMTILRKAFYVGDDEAGTLAILGPKRLEYERALSLLNFTSLSLSDALTKLLR